MSTLAEFRTLVSSVTGLDNSTGGAERTLIDKWVNDGVIEVLRRTKCRVSYATETLTAGSGDYELPSGILSINRIVDSDNNILQRVAPDDILENRRASSTATGGRYRYAVDGANLLMVYPTPAAADELAVYYTPRPTVLSLTTDDPSSTTYGGIPPEYHRAIELYALWKAADYADDASSQQGDRYARDFKAEIDSIRKDIRTKGARKLSPARFVLRDNTVPRSPSSGLV